jgi:hypothetical protein
MSQRERFWSERVRGALAVAVTVLAAAAAYAGLPPASADAGGSLAAQARMPAQASCIRLVPE